MNERGSQMVNVRIGMYVMIDSEVRFTNPTRPTEKEYELYNSVDEAKSKLDSARNLYRRFQKGYSALEFGELGLLLASVGKGLGDLGNNGDAFEGDLLRVLGVVGIGLLTITAKVTAGDNKTKTENKLSTVEQADERNEFHLRKTYPFL